MSQIKLEALSLDYLWLWIRRGNPDECWEWLGDKDDHGYGHIIVLNHASKEIYLQAHRLVWGFVHGRKSLRGKTLHHKCENPSCCNTEHCVPLPQLKHNKLHVDEAEKKKKENK